MTTRPVYYLKDYSPTPYTIPNIELEFYLGENSTTVKAKLDICASELNRESDLPPLILDGDELDLQSISVNGTILDTSAYRASSSSLELLKIPGARFSLEIVTILKPDQNLQLMGLYRSSGIFCTQCEAEGFRRITYFYDRPDVLSVYKVYIQASMEQCPVLLSNGNLLDAGVLMNGQHFAKWHDPFPKPSYLFALVAGDLDVLKDNFTTASGKKVDLAIYTEKGKSARSVFAMDSLKRAMLWDEKHFSREYDLSLFNIVAVSDFNMGAMENKGLNIFNDKCILADKDTATDSDYASIERVVAHEYFHNWTGNRITCRDWFQLCLKEGLTVYRDQEFRASERSQAVERIHDVRQLISSQFAVDAGPLSHPVRPAQYSEINNFYTTTIYEKGAELVRMLHTMFGRDVFNESMQRYFQLYDGHACTVEDFISCFANVSGRDLSQFMLWYSQSGTPHVKATISFQDTTCTIELSQSLQQGTNNQQVGPMLIPVAFSLLNEHGEILKSGLLLLSQAREEFKFSALNSMPHVSLLCSLSSPVTLEKTYLNSLNSFTKEEDRQFLLKYEKDPVNKWHNLQQVTLQSLAARVNSTNSSFPLDEEVEAAIHDLISDTDLEPALKATYLVLPSEREIAQYLGKELNPLAIHHARSSLQEKIAQSNIDMFEQILSQFAAEDSYNPSASEAGKRALYNIALFYVSIYKNDPTLAYEQYKKADNLTMRIGALVILAHKFLDSTETQEALKDFEERYAENALVLDKWFSIQASATAPGTLENIKRLCQHQAFSFNNPNRVRSLIGGFAFGNLVNFHANNGSGYDFVSNVILQIDPNNSQLAAKLLDAFSDWKKFEPSRKTLAKTTLLQMAAAANISNDLADILARMLKE